MCSQSRLIYQYTGAIVLAGVGGAVVNVNFAVAAHVARQTVTGEVVGDDGVFRTGSQTPVIRR